ncbi:MAG: formate--tetrahydrofolate ligase, partial [Myxococcales bacterium]|nr:formate--tetrahydrofolate ligase [Myxococcales bacterium]
MAHSHPLAPLAAQLGVDPDSAAFLPYGRECAKLDSFKAGDGDVDGKLIVVSGITPTHLGEGKTVTSIALSMALNRIGEKTVACLRQPSLGPVFGAKGGGAGGGKSEVLPPALINLGLTGDGHAVGAAHNLLASMVDAHMRHGNALGLDPRRVTWPRTCPVNDGALRQVITGLGGVANGVPRESFFEINEASEVMAILALAKDRADLRRRLGAIIVGETYAKVPVTAEEIGAAGAMSLLLRDAMHPNLVATTEGTPALLHAGPFANIAHGNSSLLATRWALTRSPWVVTEAGFGTDLGLEKFTDIKARAGGLSPACTVIVATIRALKVHAGVVASKFGKKLDKEIEAENVDAVKKGAGNLRHHIRIAKGFGPPVVVVVNRFPSDTPAEIAAVEAIARGDGAGFATHSGFMDGGAGAEELAREVVKVASPTTPTFGYDLEGGIAGRIKQLATRVYGAEGVDISTNAKQRIKALEKAGYKDLPICVAKTHLA